MTDETVTPDPDAEAQAGERVEQEIAEERAREAPIDDRIWAEESAAIERLEDEGIDSTGGRADDEPGRSGWLAKLRSWLGRG
jgi:hypothetical protein